VGFSCGILSINHSLFPLSHEGSNHVVYKTLRIGKAVKRCETAGSQLKVTAGNGEVTANRSDLVTEHRTSTRVLLVHTVVPQSKLR